MPVSSPKSSVSSAGDAKRNGAGNIARGDFLAVYEQRSTPAFADARTIVFEIHNDGVLARRELVLAGDGSPLDIDEVVVESWLACKEVDVAVYLNRRLWPFTALNSWTENRNAAARALGR